MLPSPKGSTAASCASCVQRLEVNRASAVGSPFTYLSNQADVYQLISSAPRRLPLNAALGIQLKSRWLPPRMMISPESTPACEYWTERAVFASGSGCEVFGVGGRK